MFNSKHIISGLEHGPDIICLYGVAGIGKSTWASTALDAIFIDINNGIRHIDVNAKTPPINTYEEFVDVIKFVRKGEHKYKTLVVDDLGGLESLIFTKVCKSGNKTAINDFDWGQGHAQAREIWGRVFAAIADCRDRHEMNVILIAHPKLHRVDPPDADMFTRYSIDMNDKTYDMIERLCDAVLFMQYETIITAIDRKGHKPGKGRTVMDTVTREAKRVLLTAERAEHRAKNRFGLPYKMGVTNWSDFRKIAKKGIENKPATKPAKKRKKRKK